MPAPGWGENVGARRSRIYRAAEKSWRLLRRCELLALDLVDRADEIGLAVAEINAAWWYYFQECYAAIHRWQPGYIDWLGIWSDAPAATVECDYMVMVSPRMFERVFPAGGCSAGGDGRTVAFSSGWAGSGEAPGYAAGAAAAARDALGSTPERPRPGGLAADVPAYPGGGQKGGVNSGAGDLMGLFDVLKPELLLVDVACSYPTEANELMQAVERRYGICR